jgi:predicted secreted hydrolase
MSKQRWHDLQQAGGRKMRLIGPLIMTGALTLALALGPARAATIPYYQVTLPADAAMHPNAVSEWWYVTGHLRDQQQYPYGFEMVIFKLDGLLPGQPHASIYRTDFAVTDAHGKRFYAGIDFMPQEPGRTVLSTARLTANVPGNEVAERFDTARGPGFSYALRGAIRDAALDLTVHTDRAPLLEGGTGLVPVGVGGYSYYYSLTNLQTAGTLTLGARELRVTGTSWMDHQWGAWDWRTIGGWDWMAIQLANGTSVSLSNLAGGLHQIHKTASVSYPHGTQLATPDALMSPLPDSWVSPTTGTRYPQCWRVAVPAIGLDAVVTSALPNQEMVEPRHFGPSYWEGSGTLRGTLRGQPITGLTYTELVGYGPKSKLGL